MNARAFHTWGCLGLPTMCYSRLAVYPEQPVDTGNHPLWVSGKSLL